MKKGEFNEFSLMDYIYQKMRESGTRKEFARFSANEATLEDIRQKYPNTTTEDITSVIDICLANEWLEASALGCGKHNNLQPTTLGFGIAKSNYMTKVQDDSILKHFMNWCNSVQGVLTLICTATAIIAVIIACFTLKH